MLAMLTSLLLALSLQIVHRIIVSDASLRLWAMAANVAGVGFVFIALRGYIPDLLSIVVGNVLLFVAAALEYQGNRVFREREEGGSWVWLLPIAGTIAAVWFTVLMPNLSARIVVVSIVIAAFRYASFIVLVHPGGGADRNVRWFVASGLFLNACTLTVRAILELSTKTSGENFMMSSLPNHSLVFVVQICLNVVLGAGLPMLVLGRTHRRLIASEVQVRYLAHHDSLTGLPNRRLLDDRLSQAMLASKRSGAYGAVLTLDLDKFKALNDTHGHDAGDLLLIEVAKRISNCVREVDTIARTGGDEFLVLLNELNADKTDSRRMAAVVTEKILLALEQPYLIRRTGSSGETTIEHHCTSSIGVALFRGLDTSKEDVLKWSDLAMYEAKQAGKGSLRIYESTNWPPPRKI